jgi:beta-N-acetylhexosaminidase
MVSRREILSGTMASLLSGNAEAMRKKVKAPPRASPTAAETWMRGLSLAQKAAQLVFIPFNGAAPHPRSREYRRFLHLVKDVRVGGLILVNWASGRVMQRAEPYTLATFVNRMQRLAPVPLLVTGDFERGASMRVSGTTIFPHAMAFGAAGDLDFTRKQGEVTAREARAMGVHWVFYPVADVNNNPDNPIINIRSFGEHPDSVARHVRAFIEGARSVPGGRVLTTAKHFPGHGDTAVDTHLRLATIPGDRKRLESVELVPFRAAIEAGVDSVMTAHLAVPALGVTEMPATLSPEILAGLLRQELGFKGLIVTDALDMGGIAQGFNSGQAAVRALEAGADVLLMPPDPEEAVDAVVAAVRQGRVTQERLEASVVRVLQAKELVGLHRSKLVDPDRIEDVVDAPEANELAQQVADRAVTLVKNDSALAPLADPGAAAFLLLAGSRSSTQGQVMAQEILKRIRGAAVLELDPSVNVGRAVAAASEKEIIVVAAFSQVGAYRSNAQLAGDYPQLMEALITTGKPVVMVALGNPYLLRHYSGVAAYISTFSTVEPSEIAAVKALFGEIGMRGRLPVSIPGLARFGEGIQLLARSEAPQLA